MLSKSKPHHFPCLCLSLSLFPLIFSSLCDIYSSALGGIQFSANKLVMGRAPCCDKANVKRGPWSPEEDATLKNYLKKHGTGGNWIALPQKAGDLFSSITPSHIARCLFSNNTKTYLHMSGICIIDIAIYLYHLFPTQQHFNST